MNRHSLFRLLAMTLVLSLALGLAACGSTETQEGAAQETPAPAAEESADGGVNVNYGISNPWDSLMPYYSVSGSNYSRIIYDKLYDRLAYLQPDGTCAPRAATSWESADDGYAILFHLDETAAFHDGTPVTAQHWVDTIALVTNPACNVLGRDTFAGLTGTDETGAAVAGETLGAEAVDETTLKLTFQNPVDPEEFLVEHNRDLYVLPTHLLGDIAPEDLVTDDFWLHPVGSGPCKFVSEVSGSTLVLAANEDYQLGAPGFDTLTITVMDKANLLTALIAGDLDYYTFGGSLSEENRPVAEQAGFTVQEGAVPGTFYELMLNNETLDSPALRQAVALSLDKQLLCQQSAGSLGTVTDTSILPGTDYSRPVGESSYDPEGARERLAQAGYEGETFSLACTSQRASLAALIQQDLAAVGIQTEIETVDSATLFAGMNDGTYDMAVASHTPNSLPLWFTGSRFTADNNIFRVQDLSHYTTLLSALEQETNATARIDLVDEWEAYLQEEMPFVPLWFTYALHVQSKTVRSIDYPAAACCNENVWQWEKGEA